MRRRKSPRRSDLKRSDVAWDRGFGGVGQRPAASEYLIGTIAWNGSAVPSPLLVFLALPSPPQRGSEWPRRGRGSGAGDQRS
jgi:hypothetical protein